MTWFPDFFFFKCERFCLLALSISPLPGKEAMLVTFSLAPGRSRAPTVQEQPYVLPVPERSPAAAQLSCPRKEPRTNFVLLRTFAPHLSS